MDKNNRVSTGVVNIDLTIIMNTIQNKIPYVTVCPSPTGET